MFWYSIALLIVVVYAGSAYTRALNAGVDASTSAEAGLGILAVGLVILALVY